MSQAGIISTTSGPSPPDVPTTFEADEGSAVPVDNTLIVSADDTMDNNANGLQTRAGLGEGLAANEVQVQLTNRITGTAQTTDGTTVEDLIDPFDVGATPGTYLMFVRVVVFNVTDNLSASYASYRVVRATGAAALSVGGATSFIFEEGAMSGILVVNGVSGNEVTLTAVGLADKTINYVTLIEFQKVT